MAQISYRANLSTATFPLLGAKSGQSVIVNRLEDVGSGASNREGQERNSPQIIALQNVLPTVKGYQSIGFVDGVSNANVVALDQTSLSSQVFSGAYLGSTCPAFFIVNSTIYYLIANPAATGIPLFFPKWIWGNPQTVGSPFGVDCSVATVNNRTFLFSPTQNTIYEFDTGTMTFLPAVVAGLVITTALGIISSKGYLIFYFGDSVFWSSTVDPLDFVPSLITGAGGGAVEELEGFIRYAAETSYGFQIFCELGTLSGEYSGNIRFPFVIKKIVSAGGVSNNTPFYPLVTPSQLDDVIFALTTKGLQLIGKQSATTPFLEVNEFLESNRIDSFSPATGLFTPATFVDVTGITPRIALLASRYLILSYIPTLVGSIPVFAYALVIDIVLNKVGRIKYPHSMAFELPKTQEYGAVMATSRTSIALMSADKSVKRVSFATEDLLNGIASEGAEPAYVVIGKFQLTRNDFCEVHEVVVENTYSEAGAMECSLLSSLDGKSTLAPTPGYLVSPALDNLRTYNFRVAGKNHSIVFQGIFDLVSLELVFKQASRR